MLEPRLVAELLKQKAVAEELEAKLKEHRFPTQAPLTFSRVTVRLIGALTDKLRKAYQEGASGESFTKELRAGIASVRFLVSQLKIVERSVTRRTPWSLISPLEKLSRQIHPNSRFVIRPQWIYNYSIGDYVAYYREAFSASFDEDELNEILSDEDGKVVPSMYVITFPYVERKNILLHTLIGHELGHPIENDFLRNFDDQEELSRLLRDVEAVAEDQCSDHSNMFEREYLRVTLGNQVTKIRSRGLAELICDLVCATIFGPAALFAIEEYSKEHAIDSFNYDAGSQFYPPWRYRMRVVAEQFSSAWVTKFLREGKFESKDRKLINAKWQEIRAIVEDRSDEKLLNSDARTRLAYASINRTLPAVRRHVKKRLSDLGISADNLVGFAGQQLLERLREFIPPDCYKDEEGSECPANLAEIINVAWISFLTDFEGGSIDLPSDEAVKNYQQRLDAMNRLSLKAVEYSEIREAWFKSNERTVS